jgi:hypothetical protein
MNWQQHFFIEAKRLFKLFERLRGDAWDNNPTVQHETARDIQKLYDTMPEQLREMVRFDHQPNPGELLVEMAHVHLCAEKVLGKTDLH